MNNIKTLFNVFPKSGTHLLLLHRQDINRDDHLPMFDKGLFQEPDWYIGQIQKRYPRSFTGHIPYSEEVRDYLEKVGYRNIFIYRDLRDAAVSLGNHAMKCGHELGVMELEKNTKIDREYRDMIAESIPIIGAWWEKFCPWIDYSDAIYRFEELRGAALLLGKEGESTTFKHGNVGDWRKRFKPYHVEMAKEYFGEWYEMP